jgi:hypothetical protein
MHKHTRTHTTRTHTHMRVVERRYFCKQGFTSKLSLRKCEFDGFIKHYDGANLMECPIIANVNYLEVPRMLRFQRNFLYDRVSPLLLWMLLWMMRADAWP